MNPNFGFKEGNVCDAQNNGDSRSHSDPSSSHERPCSKERSAHCKSQSYRPERSLSQKSFSSSRQNYRTQSKSPKPRLNDNKIERGRDQLSEDWARVPRKRLIIRSSPAEKYYERQIDNAKIAHATGNLKALCFQFKCELVDRGQRVRDSKPKYEPPPRHKTRTSPKKQQSGKCSATDSSSEDLTDEEDVAMEELIRKQKHPDRLHWEIWHNEPGEMNDRPLCHCLLKTQKFRGKTFEKCDINSNNADKLYHYRITISPATNIQTKTPTVIRHDDHDFIFEGFSIFSHFPLENLPTCKVNRYNIEYTISLLNEKAPENFCIRELDLFHEYLFREILELVDFNLKPGNNENECLQFHFMPRFVRDIEDGQEILSMCEVLRYLLRNSYPLIKKSFLPKMIAMPQNRWQNFADKIKGMIVTYPGKKPCSIRVDQLDRNMDQQQDGNYKYPEIVHFGIRPAQLSYMKNPEYQRARRDWVKFRHLLANMSRPTFEHRRELMKKEAKFREMRAVGKLDRIFVAAISAEGFYRTGIMCDVVQHAMFIPVLVHHLRFQDSLDVFENTIGYKFRNRSLLQLALTHSSYHGDCGTNPDHVRNSLNNCGIRQPEYGDPRICYNTKRHRGINALFNVMSRFGQNDETQSNISHNERLEFLGDAVIEFLTSVHLFFMFPELEEGGLTTYRLALVQNQHLAVLARTLQLDQYMLYAHELDVCHGSEFWHIMANCFEALMGALFLDSDIYVPDKIFGETVFKDSPKLLEVWEDLPFHQLQQQEPNGDRHHIPNVEILQKLTKFEKSIGVEFTHIRLLARAFTDRTIGFTNLTLGSNQRLEFLGDSVLQLISSEYLYKHFPGHREGPLSLLRTSLTNNRILAEASDDLGLWEYAIYDSNQKSELKMKDRADLFEAVLGALLVDKDLDYCTTFCNVALFERLEDIILKKDWNNPKSKLQQCCATLRKMEGGVSDDPVYKVIERKGPSNKCVYTVAVYFRGERLVEATGNKIKEAEMNAARQALENFESLHP